MAVALDAAYPQNAADPDDVGFYSGKQVTTASWSHTCTGTNLVLIVDVGLGAHPDGGIGANASYGGHSMTQVAAVHSGGSNSGLLVRFKLVNAPVGRNNVTVNVTGGKATIIGASVSFSGADQSTGLAATTYSATGNSTTQSVAVAANTNGNIIISSCASSATEGFPIGANGSRTWVRNATSAYLAGTGQGGTWAATGSSVTTSFPLDSGAPWSIISNEVLSASTGTVMLTTANLQLSAGTFGTSFFGAQWFSEIARQPNTYFAGAPPLLPLQIGISNLPGEWLFAIISWRQDGGNLGQLTFPSTVNVSDDAGNFWIPVEAGLPDTGIMRSAIWMAPAAKQATTVTISPASTQAGDALQTAMQALIFMTTAACPWYVIEETDFAYVNQGTSLTVSQQNATTGLFAVGVVASDNPTGMPSSVSSGFIWENLITFPFGNLVDNTGDMQQWGFVAPLTAGADLSLTISSNGTTNAVADLSGVIITVRGVSDMVSFPYKMPLESWPILITEIASGPVINANPLMAAGTADWTLQPANFLVSPSSDFETGAGTWVSSTNCGVAQSSVASYAGAFSLAVTSSANGNMIASSSSIGLIAVNGIPCSPGDQVSGAMWVLAATIARTCLCAVEFFDPSSTSLGAQTCQSATDSTTSWTLLSGTVTAPANAAFARLRIQVNGTAGGGGETHYIDNAFLYDGGFAASGPAGTLSSVTWPNYQPYPNYQALTGSTSDLSLALVPSGQSAVMQFLSEPEPIQQGLNYSVNAWTFCPGNNGSSLTLTPQVVWYNSIGQVIEIDNGVPVQPGIGQWDNLTFATGVSPQGGTETIVRDQKSSVATTTTLTLTITWPVNPTAGSKVLVWVTDFGTVTAPTLADNGTTPATWVLEQSNTAVGTQGIFIFRADNVTQPAAGAFTVTATLASGAGAGAGGGQSYLGVAAGGPAAANNGSATASTSVTTGAVTPGAPDSLFFAAFDDSSGLNPETITLTASGFSTVNLNNNGNFQVGAAADQIGLGSGAQTCTWTLGDAQTWNAAIVSYEPATISATSAAAAILITSSQPLIPSSAVVYVGYCGIGSTDSYENTSPDQLSWSDISVRNFTQSAISVSRGIQYEQQSLEAGHMTVTLVNSDGAMMFGNLLSTYWPNIGDTDVPIRLRSLWPQSLTPYSVLFSGFTDQITFGWDETTWFGYAEIESSDAWSRLTTQMLEPYQEEVLEDNPDVFTPLSNTGANLAVGNTTPMAQIASNFGAGSAVATFSGGEIQLPGASSLSNWQVTGIGTAATGTASLALANQGIALGYFPPGNFPLPPVNGGVTCTFFVSTQNAGVGGTLAPVLNPQTNLVICTAWSGSGPTWSIFIDNGTGNSFNTTAQLITYDQTTGAGTVTNTSGDALFLFGTASSVTTFFAVSFTQTSLTVFQATQDSLFPIITTVAVNLAPSLLGFSLGGNAGPLYATAGTVSTLGFWNSAFADFAVFPGIVPPLRIRTHLETANAVSQTGLNQSQGEQDVNRLARILGYAGATPVVLQSQGWYSVPAIIAADNDDVTALTDTNGQVTSSYFTNIASSTLAFMFVNGPGTLIYRRRLQQYNRVIGQWALGDNPANNLVTNPLNTSASVAPWLHPFGGVTLVSSSVPGLPQFFPYCALFQNAGVTSNPTIFYGVLGVTVGIPNIVPGQSYKFSVLIYSPQGWGAPGGTGGVQCYMNFFDQSFNGLGGINSFTSELPPNTVQYVEAPATRAPGTAAFMYLGIVAIGTPPANVQFFVANAQVTVVPPAPAGGGQPGNQGGFHNAFTALNTFAPEVPYLIGTHLSSDRALLFNQAILNQFGTNVNTTFQGTTIVPQPTSGVLVTIQDTPSVVARAGVPYTATLYLNNTAQQSPYYLSDPSMEDFGNWIVNTLSAPLLRPDAVAITPSSTTQAMIMALQAEIADTVTYRRRPLGAPEIQVLTYISKLTHSIDLAEGKWTTTYELSPYQAGTIIECDDVIHGPLSGGNLLGF